MAHIQIFDGFRIVIDGGEAGSLEDALSNFPQFSKELWAATHTELANTKKAHHQAICDHRDLLQKHESLQREHAHEKELHEQTKQQLHAATTHPDEEEMIEAEVEARIKTVKREQEIQRRLKDRLANIV